MRSISASIINGINAGYSYGMRIIAYISKARTYSATWDADHAPAGAEVAGTWYGESPYSYGQDMCAMAVNSPGVDAYVALNVFNKGGTIQFYVYGDSAIMTPTYSGSSLSDSSKRPGLADGGYLDDYGYIFWADGNDGSKLKRGRIDKDLLYAGTAACITAMTTVNSGAFLNASIHGIDELTVAVFNRTNGNVQPILYHYNGASWDEYACPRRFIFPEEQIVISEGLIHTAAAPDYDGNIFFYMTNPADGSVKATMLHTSPEYVWEDFFTAIPSDLSEILVHNAYLDGSNIVLSCSFRRTEEFELDQTYSLLLTSRDGRSFSMGRNTLISKQGYQMYCCRADTDAAGTVSALFMANTGRMSWETALDGTPDLEISDDVLSFVEENRENGGPSGTLRIANGDGAYIDNAYLKVGNLVSVSIGYLLADDPDPEHYEYSTYGYYVITQIQDDVGDSTRNLSLSLSGRSSWKLAVQTAPYYAEITSNAAMYDDETTDHSQLFVAPGGGKPTPDAYVDFWTAQPWTLNDNFTPIDPTESGGFGVQISSGSHKHSFQVADLKDAMNAVDYPTVLSVPFTVSLYGRGRTETTGHVNDAFKIYLFVKKADEADPKKFRIVKGTLASTYDQFPLYYYDNASGSYPIQYTFGNNDEDGDPSIAIGEHIVGIGITAQVNNATGYIIEGATLGGTSTMISFDDSNTPWVVAEDETRLEMPDFGRPYVMFTTRPFNVFNFDIRAEFQYEAGDAPTTLGSAHFGVVGLASDSGNFIYGRYNIRTSYLEIVKVREGIETVLASASYTADFPNVALWMAHRDGKIYLRVRTGKAWSTKLEYDWDTKTNGPIAVNVDVMHTGICGYINPPSFRTSGFSADDGDGIPMLAGENVSLLADFGATGEVYIDGTRYAYTAKTPVVRSTNGPVQGHDTVKIEYGDHQGVGVETRYFNWDAAADVLDDYLFSSDNGHVWKINDMDWQPYKMVEGGGTDYGTRTYSRVFGANINGDYIGHANRCYFGPGFTGISLVEGEARRHSHGERIYVFTSEKFYLTSVMASGGDGEYSVRDMIAQVCNSADVPASFPGDITYDTKSMSSGVETAL